MFSFTKKRIRIVIALQAGKFEDGSDVVIIDDLPMHVEIVKAGIPSFPEATIRIGGLSLDKMKALSMLGFSALQSYRNRVRIYAGDTEPDQLPLIFVGEQSYGAAQIDESGNASFEMKAFTGIFAAQEASGPIAVSGSSPAADVIGSLAQEAGFSFLNEGVNESVRDCVIRGDPMTKMRSVADQVGANLIIDDDNVILLPKGTPRRAGVVTISAQTGMIGYPQLNSRGISVRCLFMPSLQFGQEVYVESVLPMATGSHRIIKLSHTLDANQNDGGQWETSFESYFNFGL